MELLLVLLDIINNSLNYPPPRNRVGKLSQLPPLRIHGISSTTPRSKSGRKTLSTTPPPPGIHGISSTTSPRNRVGKLSQLPPHRIHGTSSTTPPRNRESERKLSPPNSIPRSATGALASGFALSFQKF